MNAHDADLILASLLSDDLDIVCWHASRVPSLVDAAAYEAEAMHVAGLQARVIAWSCATVAPRRGTS